MAKAVSEPKRPFPRVQLVFDPEEPRCHSRTKQSFAEECNINVIMKKFERTGAIDHQNTFQGDYGDFRHAVDYHTALNIAIEAEEMFLTVPAAIRERYGHDPQRFLEAVDDPKERAQLIEDGILPAEHVDEPSSAPAEPAPAPAAADAPGDPESGS